MPPRQASTMASTRNCSSTSRPTAPMASRMPISRVRSVTDTSMMFMMPMPPTSRLTAATAPSSDGEDARRALQGLRDLRRVEDIEVVLLRAADVAALTQQRLDRRGHGRRVVGRVDRHHHQPDVAVAGHAPLHGLDRHQHDVVLVVAEAALAARHQRADDFARQVASRKRWPSGSSSRKRLCCTVEPITQTALPACSSAAENVRPEAVPTAGP